MQLLGEGLDESNLFGSPNPSSNRWSNSQMSVDTTQTDCFVYVYPYFQPVGNPVGQQVGQQIVSSIRGFKLRHEYTC